MADLVKYYGTECVHCNEMEPMVKEVEKELKVEIDRIEVWHDSKNQAEFMKEAEGKCQVFLSFLTKSLESGFVVLLLKKN